MAKPGWLRIDWVSSLLNSDVGPKVTQEADDPTNA